MNKIEIKKQNCLSCEHGGRCCCNCVHQLKLMNHPANKTFGKGSILEPCGFACTVMYGDEDKNNQRSAIFSDRVHGICEMHFYKK